MKSEDLYKMDKAYELLEECEPTYKSLDILICLNKPLFIMYFSSIDILLNNDEKYNRFNTAIDNLTKPMYDILSTVEHSIDKEKIMNMKELLKICIMHEVLYLVSSEEVFDKPSSMNCLDNLVNSIFTGFSKIKGYF